MFGLNKKVKHVGWILNVTREARVINKDWRISLFFYFWNPNGFTSTGFDESHSLTLNEPVLISRFLTF